MINADRFIPYEILDNVNLSAGAKLFFGDLTVTCDKNLMSNKPNSFYSHDLKVSIATISKWISELKKENHIRTIVNSKNREIHIIGMDWLKQVIAEKRF